MFSHLRLYKWSKRELLNAVFYLVDSGCKWRQLPHDFPPYSTVHSFYRRARLNELWDKVLEHMVKNLSKIFSTKVQEKLTWSCVTMY